MPFNVSNAIASTDIANKEYCILNKEYTKEQYQELAPKVIQHMIKTKERWEFFSPQYAPFPYNDTIAYDYYPVKSITTSNGERRIMDPKGRGDVHIWEDKSISKATLNLWGSELIQIKRRTQDAEMNVSHNMSCVESGSLSDSVYECDDSICDKAVLCQESKRPFRITKQELAFYRKYWLPLPRLHPDIRYQKRIKNAIKSEYYVRSCTKTQQKIISVYPENQTAEVYCDGCYKKIVHV